MAHRGRLNVLVNIMGKSPKELFAEFEGLHDWKGVSGDVKYHQGYSTDIATRGGIVHVALGFNPSHLEIIDPVTEGSVRARQEKRNDGERTQGHGRAAARRRLVRRPGRGLRDAQPVADARLHHRRHHPHRHQQPHRLHHQPSRSTCARRSTAPTWARWCRRPSSTSTATIPRPWPTSPSWRSTTA